MRVSDFVDVERKRTNCNTALYSELIFSTITWSNNYYKLTVNSLILFKNIFSNKFHFSTLHKHEVWNLSKNKLTFKPF